MGVDRGFDIFPPLKDTEVDNRAWAKFLEDVVNAFKEDPKLEDDPRKPFISFDVGEGPRLERDACRFRRFSSKVSGSCGDAEWYIVLVQKIARRHFTGRVEAWDEAIDQSGHYSWTEVYSAQKDVPKSVVDEAETPVKNAGDNPDEVPYFMQPDAGFEPASQGEVDSAHRADLKVGALLGAPKTVPNYLFTRILLRACLR